MNGSTKMARNRRIHAARARGLSILQVAQKFGLTKERVRRILMDGYGGRTLTLLPGTEKLSPSTRGLLVRLGYRSVDTVLKALEQDKLYDGCAYGIGPGRMVELAAWARRQKALDGK